MNRRDFIKCLTYSAFLLTPASLLAQTPSKESLQKAKNNLSQALERSLELESVDPNTVEWISGFSNGNSCTFCQD